MDINYVVKSVVTLLDDQFRVEVVTELKHVVNGYGGGVLTFVVSASNYQAEIEKRLTWKLNGEFKPQSHDLVFHGNLELLESATEAYRERIRSEEARETEGEQRLQAEEEVQIQDSPSVEEAPSIAAPVDEQSDPDVPSVIEEPSADEVSQ